MPNPYIVLCNHIPTLRLLVCETPPKVRPQHAAPFSIMTPLDLAVGCQTAGATGCFVLFGDQFALQKHTLQAGMLPSPHYPYAHVFGLLSCCMCTDEHIRYVRSPSEYKFQPFDTIVPTQVITQWDMQRALDRYHRSEFT